MVCELQKQFEDMEAYDIIIQLKAMFGKTARVERFEIVTAILESMQNDDEPVGPHVLRMIRLFENLESSGVPLGNELATDIILYTLHKGEPKKNILMVQKEKNAFKKEDNKKKKKASGKQGTGKTVAKSTKLKNGPSPDQKCFYCNQGGHWKRNCPKYLTDLKNGSVASTSVGAQEVVSTSVEQTTDVVKPIRRTSRKSNPPKQNPLEGYLVKDGYDIFLLDMDEPTTYKAAMASTDSEKWLIAMKSEMKSMYENKVWNLVDLSKDYDETFSPVAMLKFIRILLAIASYFDYEIWQMDVKTVFLNDYLEEEVYITQSEGFVDPRSPKKVCKLQRSIYGLKQASRSWNLRFDEAIKEFGFLRNPEEACVYKIEWEQHCIFSTVCG
ncbi:UNVERIFIED_CONTAM: hypothetical protein Slati_3836600 [Sesamum latifolium]|uniref:CCHC-type domain-containing protein n=1 Tax=Sesamum latifolium TaxID=2727402 RepID=A0AAW2TKF0_9LAMI